MIWAASLSIAHTVAKMCHVPEIVAYGPFLAECTRRGARVHSSSRNAAASAIDAKSLLTRPAQEIRHKRVEQRGLFHVNRVGASRDDSEAASRNAAP